MRLTVDCVLLASFGWSTGGQVRCSDPYDGAQSDEYDLFGVYVAWACTGLFLACLFFFVFMRVFYVPYRFTPESLRRLVGGK